MKISKYLKRFQRYIADTISIVFISKEHNSVYIAYRVTVLKFYIASDHGLHLYQVSRQHLEGF